MSIPLFEARLNEKGKKKLWHGRKTAITVSNRINHRPPFVSFVVPDTFDTLELDPGDTNYNAN